MMFFILLIKKVYHKVKKNIIVYFLIFKTNVTFYLFFNREKKSHCLEGDLIISLTSYPARYKTLHLTLKCILLQNIKVSRVVLWIAYNDFPSLPKSVLRLKKYGLVVRKTSDIKSYKKIIPSLKEFPDAYIITLDDDVYYPTELVENLVTCFMKNPGHIIANRTHVVSFDEQGELLPYMNWRLLDSDNDKCRYNFQTGVGGVLYPPNSLTKDVLNEEIFLDLAPRADDVWLYWMGGLNNYFVINTGCDTTYWDWPSSQKTALFLTNSADNDVQIKRMVEHYGYPFRM